MSKKIEGTLLTIKTAECSLRFLLAEAEAMVVISHLSEGQLVVGDTVGLAPQFILQNIYFSLESGGQNNV